MSSAPDSIAAGTVLQHYRLVERLGGGAQTWIAEDTRNGNRVAFKILSRLLPKDKATRDQVLKQLRLKAAVGHPGIANIIQVDIEGDTLWMASELVEGESLTRRAQREKASKQDFFRYAWQMADVLAAVHKAGIVLGQITGGSWIITPDNDVRLVGFRFSSFMGKHDTGQTLLSTIKPANLREAAYLSPEQVAGKMVTSKTDIFALGVCLYELIAGTVPFQGATVADVAQAVASSAPPAPQNPAIERNMLAPIGKCIHKSPDSRYEKIALLKDDLAKLSPDVESIARRRGVTSPGNITLTRKPKAAAATETFIVVGELPYHEIMRAKDPARAGRLENTMQQLLGEAIYLFDGKVLDSFGPMMVASLPDGASAIRAAQKGLADLVEFNMTHGDEPVEARMLVHYGELVPTAGKPEGSGLTTAMTVLDAMEPLQLLVSKPVIDRIDADGEPVSIGRLADIDFYRPPAIREPEPETPAAAPASVAAPAGLVAEEWVRPAHPAAPAPLPAASAEVAEATPSPAVKSARKGRPLMAIGIVGILVLLLGAVGAYFVLRKGQAPPTPVVKTATPAPAPATPTVPIDPDKLHFERFTVESAVAATTIPATDTSASAAPVEPEVPALATDPELESLASTMQLTIDRIAALDRRLNVVPSPAADTRSVGGRIARDPEGIVLTPIVREAGNEKPGEPIVVTKPEDAAIAYVKATWPSIGRNTSFFPADDATLALYLGAVELAEAGDTKKALAAVERVTAAQSDFYAGQRLQMNLLLSLDREAEAIETAKRLALLDRTDSEIRSRLAEWEFSRGNPGYGLVWLGELLEAQPDNQQILTRIGQYAAAVGNEEKFLAVLTRLQSLKAENPRLSAGDLLLARGRLDAAAKKYYEDLDTQPDNPVLSLKIGRVAVLRRSDTVIQSETERLQRLGSPFEHAMLQAYVEANRGNADAAEAALASAEAAATALDPVYTATAEVYLLLNRQKQVAAALEKAIGRAEPTHDYILSNPVFGYITSDPAFRGVLQKIESQRAQISAALDNMQL